MKATLDLPAPLLRKLKAEAAATGHAIGKLIALKLTAKPKPTPPFKKWTPAGRKLSLDEYRRISEQEAAEMRAVPTVTKMSAVEVISSMRR